MATIINELPEQIRPGRAPKYPWGEWLDGKARLLEQGVDFDCSMGGVKAGAYAAARKHAIKVRIVTVDDNHLAMQAFR